MTEVVVCDASAVASMLAARSPSGAWLGTRLSGQQLVAPHLMMFEAANALRRLERSGDLTPDQAAQAHEDLLELGVVLAPYGRLGHRVWTLRAQVSVYDAAYVALAEELQAPLVTLDRRLAAAPSLPCLLEVPPLAE